jgi:hypothetical protein
MTLGLALAAGLLTAASESHCYLVTPEGIEDVACADGGPRAAPSARERRRRKSAAAVERQHSRAGRSHAAVRAGAPRVAARETPRGCADETSRMQALERRVALAESERGQAEARRLSAERRRLEALDQRDAALKDLAAIQRELAAARGRGAAERGVAPASRRPGR